MPQTREKETVIPVDRETVEEFLQTGVCEVTLEDGRRGKITGELALSDGALTSFGRVIHQYQVNGNTHLVLQRARP